jgi:hypothetical protein
MRVRVPGWSTGNDHDPGTTLLALFGFLGAGLLWRLSGRREGAASRLSRVLGVGLGSASVSWLLTRCRPQPPRARAQNQ